MTKNERDFEKAFENLRDRQLFTKAMIEEGKHNIYLLNDSISLRKIEYTCLAEDLVESEQQINANIYEQTESLNTILEAYKEIVDRKMDQLDLTKN